MFVNLRKTLKRKLRKTPKRKLIKTPKRKLRKTPKRKLRKTPKRKHTMKGGGGISFIARNAGGIGPVLQPFYGFETNLINFSNTLFGLPPILSSDPSIQPIGM